MVYGARRSRRFSFQFSIAKYPPEINCSASVENAGLGVELTHCCLRKEQWYEQTRTAALQCPRESQNPPAPFAGRQSGVGFVRTAPDHSKPVLSMAEAVFRERHAGIRTPRP